MIILVTILSIYALGFLAWTLGCARDYGYERELIDTEYRDADTDVAVSIRRRQACDAHDLRVFARVCFGIFWPVIITAKLIRAGFTMAITPAAKGAQIAADSGRRRALADLAEREEKVASAFLARDLRDEYPEGSVEWRGYDQVFRLTVEAINRRYPNAPVKEIR